MLQLIDHGSLYLIKPSDDDSDRFWDWAEEHIHADTFDENADDHTPLTVWDDALVVETNYLGDLVIGLKNDGFTFGG